MELAALILTTAIATAALVVIAVRDARRPDPASWLEGMIRRRILVQTIADVTATARTLEGTLARIDADGIALVSPRLDETGLSGEVWIPREKIAWVQRPEEPAR